MNKAVTIKKKKYRLSKPSSLKRKEKLLWNNYVAYETINALKYTIMSCRIYL